MIIGFSGTRVGMTTAQLQTVKSIFKILKIKELHHGDCMGADEQSHKLATDLSSRIVIHPPTNASIRAFCISLTILEPIDYLTRDRNIVDATEVLIASPKSTIEESRSGTWYTIKYARKQNKRLFIVYPNGDFIEENDSL